MNTREEIYQAFFDLVSQTPGLKTSNRRFKLWTDVQPPDQPALFIVQRGEQAKFTPRTPTIWTLHLNVVLYGHNGGQESLAPMSNLNPIIDAVVAKLLPTAPMYEEQTLGGLVERCRIDGEIQTDEGTLGDQAVAVIPITILVPQ